MTKYVTSEVIRTLREKKKYTQKQLADILSVSDKTISKWETGKGLPDITLIEPLAKALNVSVAELLSGEYMINRNKSANMLKCNFYVCPVCGNVINSTGEGAFSCCGITLPPLEAESAEGGDKASLQHSMDIKEIEDEYYVTLDHPMEKEHYISFFVYATFDRIQTVKLYPEQDPGCRIQRGGRGMIYAYCNKHGFFKQKI